MLREHMIHVPDNLFSQPMPRFNEHMFRCRKEREYGCWVKHFITKPAQAKNPGWDNERATLPPPDVGASSSGAVPAAVPYNDFWGSKGVATSAST